MEVISPPAPLASSHFSCRSSHYAGVDSKPGLLAGTGPDTPEVEDEEFVEDGERETPAHENTSSAPTSQANLQVKRESKTSSPAICGCDPCECDLEASDDECIPTDIILKKPVDLSIPFYEKLQHNLTHLRQRYCADTLGKPPPTQLTRELISELLIERKDIAQIFCYLPGDELYPWLLPHRVNDKDMCNICSVLSKHVTITTLNFAYNDIGDRGLKRLAKTIKVFGNISHVNLMHNNFTAAGLEHLVRALVDRAPLQTLRMTGVKFGDAGIDVLTCLLLSGKAPTDLDIGECDLSIDGFQTLCTALHALDHDIDYPEFLRSRKLPFDLDMLKTRKQRYNDEWAEVVALTGDSDPAAAELRRLAEKNVNAQANQGWNRQQKLRMDRQKEEKEQIPLIFQEFSATLLKGLFDVQHKLSAPDILVRGIQSEMQPLTNSETELAQEAAALALEEFELSAVSLALRDDQMIAAESGQEPDMAELVASLALEEIELSAGIIAKSWQIAEEARHLGSLDEYIRQYKGDGTDEASKVTAEEDYYSHPVVSPSLYKLDYYGDEQLLTEFAYELDGHENDHEHEQHGLHGDGDEQDPRKGTAMAIYHGQVIDFNQPALKRTVGQAEGCDDITAQAASRLVAQDVIKSAAETIAASEPISEKANIIQLLYMALVDLARMRTRSGSSDFLSSDHTVRICTEMMDAAINALQAVLVPQIPEQCATLSEDVVKLFVRSLVKTASDTFMSLLNNDEIAKALARDGSLACRQVTWREPPNNENDSQAQTQARALTGDQIRFMAMEFLNGAIEEAGRLIGSGDPFGFHAHTKHDNANAKKFHGENDEKTQIQKESAAITHGEHAAAQEILDVELGICDAVDKLIDLGGQLAAAAKEEAQALHEVEKLFHEAANEFVESLFGEVREALEEYLKRIERNGGQDKIDKEALKQLKYAHVSRPTRLVLNRPFFAHYEDLMATKLGEYLEGNHTLKALHIQKWGLREDGMLSLMNGLMKNKTLRTLDLSCNGLGADGMKMLGLYLATNKNLKHLVLSHNGLKDPGVANLTAQITESNLISLNIAYNNVTWVGLDPLLTAIPDTKIYALYVWGNQFGLETWRLFQDLLATGTLTHSDMLLQQVDDTFFTVKNSQARDTMNQYYDVPPKCEGLIVPPYMTDPVHALNYEDLE